MAMLAGPKRKQKWTLNPRGKQWSEDSSKFGQKMLEKMGWTSGKGLGAKEQGMVEHIRVKVKNDQVGIGFDKNRDDQWTEHQDDFNSFLQNLQKEQAGAVEEIPEEKVKVLSGKSLEEKSKLSQKRVHYKKFTRGKDVNKYSTKDLANIFGKRDLNEKPVQEEKEEENEKVYDPVGTQDHTAGILTIKGGNINDYFKNKFNYGEHCSAANENDNSESELEQRVGFGFSAKSKSTFYVNNDDTVIKEESDGTTEKYSGFGFVKSSDSKSKSKKHNNLNYVFDNPCLDMNILDDSPVPRKVKTDSVDLEQNEKATPRKRKNEFIYDNVGLDLDYADRPTPKKIKTEPVLNSYENPALDLDCSDITTPKKKKKKKTQVESAENGYDNSALDFKCPDTPKFESAIHGIENPALDVECPDRPTPKKNKKSKAEPAVIGIENPGLDLDYPDRPTPKKNKKAIIEPVINGIVNPGLDLEFPDRPTPKKSKKAKEIEILTSGIQNPGLDLEFPDRPTPKKSKKVKEVEVLTNGIENPALDLEAPDKPTPRKSKKSNEIEILSTAAFSNPVLDLDNSNEVYSTSDFEVSRATCGLQNNALDLSDENSSKRRVTFNDQVEYNTDTNKKKKKKRKLDKYEVVNEKSKKKCNPEPEPAIFVNEGLDLEIINAEELDNEINERKSMKGKRKRRERRMSHLETIEEAPEEENSSESPKLAQNSVQNSDNDVEVVNEFTSEDIQEITNANSSKKKNKKKKDKQKRSEEIDISEENVNKSTNEVPSKKKKDNATEKIEEITLDDKTDDRGKENVCYDKNEETNPSSKKDKKKKKKKSEDDVVTLEEFLNEEPVQEKKPKVAKKDAEAAPSVTENTADATEDDNLTSFQKFKKSKQVMKSLFIKNPTLMFNGSNINEIKGYGSHLTNHY